VVGLAFGGDAGGAIVGAGAAAFGHHGAAIGATVLWGWVGVGGGHAGHWVAQAGEQQGAAGGGDVGVPGRRGQDQRAIGQLLFGPAPKSLFTEGGLRGDSFRPP
jgi:hypothetical protein